MASPQRPVYTLAITDPKWVRAYVAEADLGRIRPGMAATLSTDSHPGQPLAGKVGYISSVAEFTPKTVQTEELRSSLVYEVRVLADDTEDRLRLGMPATVRLSLNGARHALMRPPPPSALAGRGLCKGFAVKASGRTVQALADVSLDGRRRHAHRAGRPRRRRQDHAAAAGGRPAARPTQGTLEVLGIDVAADPQAVQDRISYMPQRFGLYEDLSVQENLDLYADLHGVPQDARRERYARLMEMTDLGRFTSAARRQALRRHEAEAGPGLHAGALAGAAAARRADRRRRPAVAARAVGDRRSNWSTTSG